MTRLDKLLFVPVAALAASFAVANRTPATLSLWPLPFEIELPLYVAVLGALALGGVLGAVAAWFSAGKFRRRARTEARKARSLERELRDTDGRSPAPPESAAAPPARPPP